MSGFADLIWSGFTPWKKRSMLGQKNGKRREESVVLKMTIKTRKGIKNPLLCQEKTEHVRSTPLKNGAC